MLSISSDCLDYMLSFVGDYDDLCSIAQVSKRVYGLVRREHITSFKIDYDSDDITVKRFDLFQSLRHQIQRFHLISPTSFFNDPDISDGLYMENLRSMVIEAPPEGDLLCFDRFMAPELEELVLIDCGFCYFGLRDCEMRDEITEGDYYDMIGSEFPPIRILRIQQSFPIDMDDGTIDSPVDLPPCSHEQLEVIEELHLLGHARMDICTAGLYPEDCRMFFDTSYMKADMIVKNYRLIPI